MADDDSKTEDATPKRRTEAAKRGEIWQSRELGTALVMAGGTGWLILAGPSLFEGCVAVLARGLSIDGRHSVDVGVAELAGVLLRPGLVFAGIVVLAGIAGPLLLGPRWSPGAAAPKASRVDPLAGLKRMVGLQPLVELGKAIVKAVLLGAIGWHTLGGALNGLSTLGDATPLAAAARLGSLLASLMTTLTLTLIVIAAIDLPWQRSRWLAKLRMTKQEVRDEHKESQGSPEVRAAQRRMARAAARAALRPAMAEATVVTVNPSEFAVALRYDPARDAAPVIVARGRDIIAAAIRELAAERNVPVLRYPQLTRAIFFTGAVGQPIRDDLYGAAAAVLAFVFSLDAEVPRPQPIVEVPVSARFDESGRATP